MLQPYERTYERTVVIHDANWNRFELDTEIRNRNCTPVYELKDLQFSICWDGWWSLWQNDWHIVPKDEYQKQLLDIWGRWHLNWMSGWCPEQDNAIEIFEINNNKKLTYDEKVSYLQLINKYTVIYKWDEYTYWKWWVYKDLPEDFIETLDTLFDKLDELEAEYNSELITLESIDDDRIIDKAAELWELREKLIAVWVELKLSFNALENIKCDWNLFTIEWTEYLVCTESEAESEHYDYVKNLIDDIWLDQFAKNMWWPYFKQDEDWNIEVSQTIDFLASNRWEDLNSYDWNELSIKVWDEWFYIYRRG
jgi:hypothetical protein